MQEVAQMTEREQKLRDISLKNGVAIASDVEGQKIIAEKNPAQTTETTTSVETTASTTQQTQATPETTATETTTVAPETTTTTETKLSVSERAEKRQAERLAAEKEAAERKEYEDWKKSDDKKLIDKAKAEGKTLYDLTLSYKPIDVDKLSEKELFETLVSENKWDADKIAEQYELFSEKADFEKMEILKPVKNALIADNEKKKADLTTPLSSNTQSTELDPKMVEAMNTFQTELYSKLESIEGKDEGGLNHTAERVDKIHDFIRDYIDVIASQKDGLNADKAIKLARYVLFDEVIEANLVKQGKEEGRVEAHARYTRPSNGAEVASTGSPETPMTTEQRMKASLEYHRQKHGIQTAK